VVTVILVICWLGGAIFIFRSAYFFIKLYQSIASGKEFHARVNPFSILFSSNFTKQGNIYRAKFFKEIGIAIVCLIAFIVFHTIFKQ
jgi:hypothetical protein